MPGIVAERVSEHVTALPLVERRCAGEVFPRVPVAGVELPRELVAVALFLEGAGLPVVCSDLLLLSTVRRAVEVHGVAGLAGEVAEFSALPVWERAAQDAWGRAYRLCVRHWYEGAVSRWMHPGEVAAALYFSTLKRQPREGLRGRVVDLEGYMRQGIATVGADAVAHFGAELDGQYGAFHPTAPSAAAVTAMPDQRRREWCFSVALSWSWLLDVPLLVRFIDSAHYAVGIVPPADPFDITPAITARRTMLRNGGAA